MKTFKQVLEDMSLAPKGKGREGAKKLYRTERVKSSQSTKSKILKPLDRQTSSALKLKVRNMISDLDYIAWQFENQLDVAQRTVILTTKQADRIIKELKSLERIL